MQTQHKTRLHHLQSVHHFNCGTLEPPGLGMLHAAQHVVSILPNFVQEGTLSRFRSDLKKNGAELSLKPKLVTHACALQTTAGIVLIDAGFSEEFLSKKKSFGHRQRIYNVQEGESAALVHQLTKQGMRPEDVKHIILTHLDFDHASGCFDFPMATVHVMHDEWLAATSQKSVFEKIRYGYEISRLRPRIRAHSQFVGTRWFGFPAIQPVPELADLYMIPLPGHTSGHCGVAFCQERKPLSWTLHCGDAYIERLELEQALGAGSYAARTTFGKLTGCRLNAGLALHQNRSHAAATLRLLRNLPKSVSIISTHAPEDFNETCE